MAESMYAAAHDTGVYRRTAMTAKEKRTEKLSSASLNQLFDSANNVGESIFLAYLWRRMPPPRLTTAESTV